MIIKNMGILGTYTLALVALVCVNVMAPPAPHSRGRAEGGTRSMGGTKSMGMVRSTEPRMSNALMGRSFSDGRATSPQSTTFSRTTPNVTRISPAITTPDASVTPKLATITPGSRIMPTAPTTTTPDASITPTKLTIITPGSRITPTTPTTITPGQITDRSPGAIDTRTAAGTQLRTGDRRAFADRGFRDRDGRHHSYHHGVWNKYGSNWALYHNAPFFKQRLFLRLGLDPLHWSRPRWWWYYNEYPYYWDRTVYVRDYSDTSEIKSALEEYKELLEEAKSDIEDLRQENEALRKKLEEVMPQ